LKFRDGVFHIDHNRIAFKEQKGFKLSNVLPASFYPSKESNIEYSSSPVSRTVQSVSAGGYDTLFSEKHLNLIHSYYFGTVGLRDKALTKYPVQLSLFQSSDKDQGVFRDHGLSSGEMEIARTNLITAMTNMWSKNSIVNSLVNSTLGILLKIHLNRQEVERNLVLILL
jgi:hypothetical protein